MRRSRLFALPLVLLIGAPLALLTAQPASAARPTLDRELLIENLNEQVEWTVPDGVTQVRAELAAGAGVSSQTSTLSATGGPGGFVVADVPVTPGETLAVRLGTSGSTSGAGAGEASVLARATGELLIVVGGGGAAGNCEVPTGGSCGSGGAGGLSATAGGVDGEDANGAEPGAGATGSGPGASGTRTSIVSLADFSTSTESGTAPVAAPATVNSGLIAVPATTQPPFSGAGAGGSGYFAAGHGGAMSLLTIQGVFLSNGGGGGGSGYLDDSATLVELRDSLGDGRLTLRWSEPAPPAIALAAAEVEQGGEITVSGTGFGAGEELRVVLNSDPIDLGGVAADGDGAFSTTLTVPTSAPVGDHVITVGSASAPLRVLAAAAPPVDPVDPTDPVEPSLPRPELASPGEPRRLLAETGAPAGLAPLGVAALSLVLAGALALRGARRTSGRETA